MDRFEFMIEDCTRLNPGKLKNVSEKRGHTYGRLYRFNKYDFKKHSFLQIDYCKNLETENYIVKIEGSIRKWYLGKNSLNDLSEKEFKECINLIAQRLGIVNEEFWNCKIPKLEISLTVKLKAKYKHILKSFVYYRNMDLNTYGTNSLAFVGDSYGIKLYDAIEKVLSKKRIIKVKNGKTIENEVSRKAIDLINSRAFFVRCELDINKPRGMKGSLINVIKSPTTIRDNWSLIHAEFKTYLGSIVCLSLNDESGNNISLSVIRRKLELGEISIREYDRLVIAYIIGIEKYYEDINLLSDTNTRNRQRKQFKDLLNTKMTKCDDLTILLKGYDKAFSKTEI